MEALGLAPKLRPVKGGTTPLLTDEGNYILDCMGGPIANPSETAHAIRSIVGVVEHGLFLNMANIVLIAGNDGVEKLEVSQSPSFPASSAEEVASNGHV
jgi:ribose 5-phosphate isomerase A